MDYIIVLFIGSIGTLVGLYLLLHNSPKALSSFVKLVGKNPS